MAFFQSSQPVPPGNSSYDHEGAEGDHSVIQKIVDEHGPAKAHTLHEEGDTDTVVSQHPDGHTHVSLGHPDAVHAIGHIAVAHGVTL
jgi:hypothetical protein